MGGEPGRPLRDKTGKRGEHVPENDGADDLFGADGMPDLTDILNDDSLAAKLAQMLPPEEREIMMHMGYLIAHGVTPEEYTHFYTMVNMMTGNMPESRFDDSEEADFRNRDCEPLADAAGKTLRLKVQMKEVHKPPMWREVEVPADASFLDLHHVIQIVMGFDDCHLWDFSDPNHRGISISVMPEEDSFMDRTTDEAAETPLTAFLREKGDKMNYEYDFGDSWEFSIEVKEVLDRKCEHPVCTKYKGDMNPIEDSGGLWGYETNRENFSKWATLSKGKRRQIADEFSFDTPEEYFDWLSESLIDLDEVNDALADFWRN